VRPKADHVCAYSFIATNLPTATVEQVTELEAWHRGRTDIADRIRDARHGAALRHMPSVILSPRRGRPADLRVFVVDTVVDAVMAWPLSAGADEFRGYGLSM
jgi:hypothetical protein